MSSSFGTLFRVTTFGESHCAGVGAVLDGCPARLPLSAADIQPQLDRRRPGQSDLATPRQEADCVQILSGVENGLTLGTPIGLFVPNRNQRPGDYRAMSQIPRPSHADYTYQMKYGIRASSGGGRSSARETIGRVACGAIAEKLLRRLYGIEIVAWVSAVGSVSAPDPDLAGIDRTQVDRDPTRCTDPAMAAAMRALIEEVRDAHDSIGGVVSCVCRNVPPGLGEPVFEKLEAKLAQAMLSIPATKGFEIGSGFTGTRMRGSEHNDPFVPRGDTDSEGRAPSPGAAVDAAAGAAVDAAAGAAVDAAAGAAVGAAADAAVDAAGGRAMLTTRTNHSGGIQGGISNGAPITMRVAFKPPATIGLPQETVDFEGRPVTLEAKGRHDPCVVPRAVPIVESMAALVLADMALRQHACVTVLRKQGHRGDPS